MPFMKRISVVNDFNSETIYDESGKVMYSIPLFRGYESASGAIEGMRAGLAMSYDEAERSGNKFMKMGSAMAGMGISGIELMSYSIA